MKKSREKVIAEFVCYSLIAAIPPWIGVLESDKQLVTRVLIATAAGSILAVANAVKAYISQNTQ